MAATSEPRLKITYATLRNDNEQLHASYDAGLATARGELGATHGLFINGEWRSTTDTFEKRSPIDDTLVGEFAKGTRQDVRDAIAAARAAAPHWAGTPWRERIAIMRRMADLISERQMELAALMAIEVGKNRLEALGDVEETADLIRYYCDQFDANEGFDHAMGNLGDATVHTRSVLKPHGVWAVISPFNFPMALSGGPAGGALVAGNAVVYKPSSDAPLCGVKLAEIADRAGLPRGVFNMVTGPGASRRRRAAGERRDRRAALHRLFRDRLQPRLQGIQPALSQAGHRRDGRQEPGHRQRAGGPRRGGRRRHAVCLRVRRAEMLGLQPGLRRGARVRRVPRTPPRQDQGDHRRRPDRPQELARAARERRGPGQVRSRRRRGPARWADPLWRRVAERPRLSERAVRGSDDRRRPPARASNLARRAVRPAASP